LRVAGDELDEHIVSYIKKAYSLAIGERTAETLKVKMGCAFDADRQQTAEVRGRDLISGLPKTITINQEEILTALSEPINAIVDAVKSTLEKTPPELASDIMEAGIMLTGGGALLDGLDRLITEETGMPVKVANEPLNCVVNGTGLVLENINALRSVLITQRKLKV
jgi:rod shape-determining protein MreB